MSIRVGFDTWFRTLELVNGHGVGNGEVEVGLMLDVWVGEPVP